MLLRVNNSILAAFNNVDGGGNYISKDMKSTLDQYTKSIHNLMGMVTGALPTGKYEGVALTDGSLSAMPGTDTRGATALVMSAAKGNRPEKWASSHMNMKLPPDQLDTRKGRDSVMNLVKTLFDNGGYHIQFNVLDTSTRVYRMRSSSELCRDANNKDLRWNGGKALRLVMPYHPFKIRI
jgi:formate C-acetyltransferase